MQLQIKKNVTQRRKDAKIAKEGDEAELLTLLIEKYEEENYPIKATDPIEAIKFRMEQMNLKKTDLAMI